MEEQPGDTLLLLCSLLTLKDILALATTNKDLKRKKGLTGRLIDASKIGDVRIIDRLIELGANSYDLSMIHASQWDIKELLRGCLS